jgi:hypothetical protein
MKIGPSSMAAVLPKNWVDSIMSKIETDEITVNIFGKHFLVLEVKGLEIKDEDSKKMLEQLKEHFSD